MQDEKPTNEKSDIEKNILVATLSYYYILPSLIGGAYKKSPFARFHFNQTLIILECVLVVILFMFVFAPLILNVSEFWGIIIFLLCLITNAYLYVMQIVGAINAATGKMKRLPIIGVFNVIELSENPCVFCERREAVMHFYGNNQFDEGDYCAKCADQLNLY
jgi:uncharacterized membrane protein